MSLLVAGKLVVVDGLEVVPPASSGGPGWARLTAGDYRSRRASYVSQVTIHTTKGVWPQPVRPGAGPPRVQRVAESWARDPAHAGGHLVVDGHRAVCLADVVRVAAYHATASNDRAIGIEMYQEEDGTIYQQTLLHTVRLVRALCGLSLTPELGGMVAIPYQIVADAYQPGRIVQRLRNGGADVVGIYGHRDQSWVEPGDLAPAQRALYPGGRAGRGRGDPGDAIYATLLEDGAEPFRYGLLEDRSTWRRRQQQLNLRGAALALDGIPGPATLAAMRRFGWSSGRAIDAAVTSDS
ncbi:MAG: hypothetical protein ACTHU0_01460 [Kofleriaceae bacterium]